MKVIAYTALHYGRDFLAYAIQSIIEHVSEYHVIYAAQGSHGHRTQIPCPETRDELYSIASTVAGSKLRWHDGEWAHEGLQRDSIHQYAPDADVIVVLDADEIWNPESIPKFLKHMEWAHYGQVRTSYKQYRVPMIHYWRSFYRAVLHDPAYPVRFIIPDGVFNDAILCLDNHDGTTPNRLSINHMGYAQRPEIVEYKILTHGHRNEWRHDVDWFKDKYLANAQTDCHPVGSEYWNPEPVNPLDFMPAFMQSHPYYKLQVIE